MFDQVPGVLLLISSDGVTLFLGELIFHSSLQMPAPLKTTFLSQA